MAKEFFRMTRPQTNEFGTWVPGPLYEITSSKIKEKVALYEERGFAERVSEKEKRAASKAADDAAAVTAPDS